MEPLDNIVVLLIIEPSFTLVLNLVLDCGDSSSLDPTVPRNIVPQWGTFLTLEVQEEGSENDNGGRETKLGSSV